MASELTVEVLQFGTALRALFGLRFLRFVLQRGETLHLGIRSSRLLLQCRQLLHRRCLVGRQFGQCAFARLGLFRGFTQNCLLCSEAA